MGAAILAMLNSSSRVRTNEQIAREYAVLLEVEERRGIEKKAAAAKTSNSNQYSKVQDVVEITTTCKPETEPAKRKPISREIAAKKLNVDWSGQKAEQASNAVAPHYIDGHNTRQKVISCKDTTFLSW